MIQEPVSVYLNWSAYDEISDTVELTEALALRQLDEVIRLRRLGARFDYYVMDCFWFARDGGYRTWRTPHFPDGPDRWLSRCREAGILPGLWIASNDLGPMAPVPEWQDSLDTRARAMCMFAGGFLAHLEETLRLWYARGVRLFKFDFVNFDAVPDRLRARLLPSEIRAANASAFRGALAAFRADHPDVLLLGYNGFDEIPIQGYNRLDVIRAVDTRWLEVFDSLYCGDPRIADVPAMNFWRAKDIYTDHQVRYYRAMGFPADRIDNAGFMVGNTGCCYHRGAAAWKGTLLLSLARGGRVITSYGEMERLADEDGRWFAQAQAMFFPLLARGDARAFGPLPATGEPYGFSLHGEDRALIVAVNPGQNVSAVDIPARGPARILFHDAGFPPRLEGSRLTLGPEQMALVGCGSFADEAHDLGAQEDVLIPARIDRLEAEFAPDGDKALVASTPPPDGDLRIVVRQFDEAGEPLRTSGGPPPDGIPVDRLLRLEARQAGRPLPIEIRYGKRIWSGISWAVGEIARGVMAPDAPVEVRFTTAETRGVKLRGALYNVCYQRR